MWAQWSKAGASDRAAAEKQEWGEKGKGPDRPDALRKRKREKGGTGGGGRERQEGTGQVTRGQHTEGRG